MQGEVKFTFSGVVSRGNKKLICVRFERERDSHVDVAEGEVPQCKITSSVGFSKDEVEQMEVYLTEQKDVIIQEARKINSLSNLLS